MANYSSALPNCSEIVYAVPFLEQRTIAPEQIERLWTQGKPEFLQALTELMVRSHGSGCVSPVRSLPCVALQMHEQ